MDIPGEVGKLGNEAIRSPLLKRRSDGGGSRPYETRLKYGVVSQVMGCTGSVTLASCGILHTAYRKEGSYWIMLDPHSSVVLTARLADSYVWVQQEVTSDRRRSDGKGEGHPQPAADDNNNNNRLPVTALDRSPSRRPPLSQAIQGHAH